MADDAGALLVRNGLVTDQALLAARQARANMGGTLGEHLVLAGALADETLTEFYRSRLLVPRVNPNSLARLSPTVVEAIPSDMAIEFRCVPVSLDRDGNLTVAMSDPSDRHAVDEVGFFTSKYVVRAVATQMQIAWCLAHYYGHITELGRRLLRPSAASAAPPAAPAAPPPSAAPAAPLPRVRGFTGRVEAARHRVLPPVAPGEGAAPGAAARPSDELLTPTPEDLARVEAARAGTAAPATSADAAPDAPSSPADSSPYAAVDVAAATDETTSPRGIPRRRVVAPDPPELAARAGEVEVHASREPTGEPLPAVVVALDDEAGAAPDDDAPTPSSGSPAHAAPDDDTPADDTPAIVHDEAGGTESQPILLVPRGARASRDTLPDDDLDEPAPIAAPDDDADDEDGGASDDDPDDEPVVLLDRPKPSDDTPTPVRAPRRSSRPTQIGVGIPAALPRVSRLSAVAPALGAPPPAPAVAPPEPVAPADGVPAVLEERPSDAHTRPNLFPDPPSTITDAVDDGWGPPGTTIPPPFLGAMPGTDPEDTGRIPLPAARDDDPDDDGVAHPPLLVAPPPRPPRARTGELADPAAAARELEAAATRLVDLLRQLDRAAVRDEVITALLDYLALTHQRVAFLALKQGGLTPFVQRPPSPHSAPLLPLDRPSTLQDVVGTRLPYRGAIADDATRAFVTAAFGSPPDEVLILPIAVRDRVVAVLYGDHRTTHSYDEHFAIASRAAGLALERILQARRASTSS